MSTVKTPYRISFAGGGTDLLTYALVHGGHCIGCAINRCIDLTLDNSGLVNSSDLERYSGLGGSAAYFAGLTRITYPHYTKAQIIDAVTYQEKLGQQDQVLCVTGGLNEVTFNPNGTTIIKPIPPPYWLNECMSIYYMGDRKTSGKNLLSGINIQALHDQKAIVPSMVKALKESNFEDFVDTLQEAWTIKKGFRPDILTDHVKEFEATCQQKGILALKLCGAGGGGYALLIREPKSKPRIGIPIKVDMSGQVFIR